MYGFRTRDQGLWIRAKLIHKQSGFKNRDLYGMEVNLALVRARVPHRHLDLRRSLHALLRWALIIRVQGAGLRVQGSEFGVQGPESRV